jgi:hypothetical protein
LIALLHKLTTMYNYVCLYNQAIIINFYQLKELHAQNLLIFNHSYTQNVEQKLTLNKQSPHQGVQVWQLDQTFSFDTLHDFSAMLVFPVSAIIMKHQKNLHVIAHHATKWNRWPLNSMYTSHNEIFMSSKQSIVKC